MRTPFKEIGFAVLTLLSLARPTLAQSTTLNLSHDLVPLGIAATNMVPNQPAQDAGPLLQSGIGYAASHHIGRVIADPGAYYFLTVHANTHADFGGLLNMTIDFQGADLIFSHPLYYGIIVYPSTNVTLQNFTVDYQPLPFTQVRVDAVDVANAKIQYSVEPGWTDPSTFNSLTGWLGSVPDIELHIFRNGRPVLGRLLTQRPFSGNVLPIVNTSMATLAAVRPGDIAVVALKSGTQAIGTNHCSSCTLRNITVFSATSGGVLTLPSPSSVLERVYSIPKPGTDRLVSTFGLAIGVVGPNNQIRLSRSIRTMDDGFAYGGRVVGNVQNQPGSTSLTVIGTGGETVLGDGDTIPNGSPVAFQRTSDGLVLGSAIIVSQSAPTGFPPQATFTFDRALSENLIGTVMYSTDSAQNGGNSVLERSTVQSQSCCRGLNIAALADSAVRGNYIRHSAFSGIDVLQGMTGGEPPVPPVVNLTIANNVLDGTSMKSDWWWFEFGAIQTVTLTSMFDLMTTSPFSNINVTNNFIADSGRSGIWLGNSAGGSVSGNYIFDANVRPDLGNAYPPRIADALLPLVIDTTSNGITTTNNVIDNTSGRMFVTDTQYRELAAYAPGATIRLNTYNLGTLATPAFTLTDADGKTLPMTIQNITTHNIDVQLPATAALGGAYVTLTSGSSKYFGTLFIDSQDNIPAVNGCTYETSPSTTRVPATATSISMLVITQPGCPNLVIDTDPYVTINGPASGTGVFTVGFALNVGPERNTSIEIAGEPITLTQDSVVLPVSVTPSSGVGLSQKFAALYRDALGTSDIQVAMLNLNTSSSLVNACVAKYVPTGNQLWLMDDLGADWIGPASPGSAGTLQNNQCTLDPQNSSIEAAGIDMTVNFALTFKPAFLGLKSMYMEIGTNTVYNGWLAKGSWLVGLKKTPAQLTSQ